MVAASAVEAGVSLGCFFFWGGVEPIPSMFGIFSYTSHKIQPNVGIIYHTWMLWGTVGVITHRH